MYLLIRPRPEDLVNFKFQWFFFRFLIFCLFELHRLAIGLDTLLVTWSISICAEGGLVTYTWYGSAIRNMKPIFVRIGFLQSYLFVFRIEIWFWNEIQNSRLGRFALFLCLYQAREIKLRRISLLARLRWFVLRWLRFRWMVYSIVVHHVLWLRIHIFLLSSTALIEFWPSIIKVSSFKWTIDLNVIDKRFFREAEIEWIITVLDCFLSLVWHCRHKFLVLLHKFLTARQHSLAPDPWALLNPRLVFWIHFRAALLFLPNSK